MITTSSLSNSDFFNGIQEDEIEHLISCLNGRKKTYTKGEVIYHAGDKVHEIGLILSGSVLSSTFLYLWTLVLYGILTFRERKTVNLF